MQGRIGTHPSFHLVDTRRRAAGRCDRNKWQQGTAGLSVSTLSWDERVVLTMLSSCPCLSPVLPPSQSVRPGLPWSWRLVHPLHPFKLTELNGGEWPKLVRGGPDKWWVTGEKPGGGRGSLRLCRVRDGGVAWVVLQSLQRQRLEKVGVLTIPPLRPPPLSPSPSIPIPIPHLLPLGTLGQAPHHAAQQPACPSLGICNPKGERLPSGNPQTLGLCCSCRPRPPQQYSTRPPPSPRVADLLSRPPRSAWGARPVSDAVPPATLLPNHNNRSLDTPPPRHTTAPSPSHSHSAPPVAPRRR